MSQPEPSVSPEHAAITACTWPLFPVALVAFFIALIWTTCGVPYWIDSNEFVVTGYLLQNPHPPGHPLYTLLSKAVTFVPVGSIAWRINLLSALLAVLSLACYWLALRELQRSLFPRIPPLFVEIAAFVSATAILVTQSLWFQSVRAEVYTLHLALAAAILFVALRWHRLDNGDRRYGLTIGLLCGFAISNHHFLLALLVPSLVVLLAGSGKWRDWLGFTPLSRLLAFVLLGMACYALLAVRASLDPAVNWGDPSTFSRFVDVLLAKKFQKSVTQTVENSIIGNFGQIALHLMMELGPVMFSVAICGLVLALLRHPLLGAFLATALFGNILSKALMAYDRNNPDAHGYLLTSLVCLGICACYLLFRLLDGRDDPRWRRIVLGVFLLVSIPSLAWRAAVSYPRSALQSFRATEHFTVPLYHALPNDSLVLSNYYSVFFNHWYFSYVENRRPDLDVAHLSFEMGTPRGRRYVAHLCRRRSDFCKLGRGYLRRPRFPIAIARQLAQRRPLFIENHPQLVLPVRFLNPEAYMLRAFEPVEPRRSNDLWRQIRRRMQPGDWTRESRELHFWFHVLTASVHLQRGELSAFENERALLLSIPGMDHVADVPHVRQLNLWAAQMKRLVPLAGRESRQLMAALGACRGAADPYACERAARDRFSRHRHALHALHRQMHQRFRGGFFGASLR